jgi:hypothetical protein
VAGAAAINAETHWRDRGMRTLQIIEALHKLGQWRSLGRQGTPGLNQRPSGAHEMFPARPTPICQNHVNAFSRMIS